METNLNSKIFQTKNYFVKSSYAIGRGLEVLTDM